jgi:hypothetical protein
LIITSQLSKARVAQQRYELRLLHFRCCGRSRLANIGEEAYHIGIGGKLS